MFMLFAILVFCYKLFTIVSVASIGMFVYNLFSALYLKMYLINN